MTIVGLIAVLTSLCGLAWGFVNSTNRRFTIFLLSLLAHIAASVTFYYYVQLHDSDTALYYFDPYHYYTNHIEIGGTYNLLWVVQTLRSVIGGSYLDYFLIFQTIGFFGIVLVARTMEEICIELNTFQPTILFLIIFMPGMYFWTSTIYKDPILFLGCAMATWSMLSIRSRWVIFACGTLLMVPFRAHIAVLTLLSLLGALAINRRANPAIRVIVGIGALAGLAFLARNVESSLGVNIMSGSSITGFVSKQNEFTSTLEGAVSGASLVTLPLPLRMLSLLFRPFFFDIHDIFGLFASFENLFMVYIVFYLLINWRLCVELFISLPFFRFSGIFFVSLTLLLSILYYNVGLGLRQRTTFLPAFFSIFACVYQISRIRRATKTAVPQMAAQGI